MLGIGVCILLLLFFLSKTYLEVKSSQISYEKMDDPSFCMLDLNAEELAYMELHTEAVKVKHTTDEKYMQAMIDELNRSSLLGVGNSPWSEASDHGGDYTCYISFGFKNGEMREIQISEIERNEEKPEDSIFIFRSFRNGALEGRYNSEYFGKRFYFQGKAVIVFGELYEMIL